MQAYWVGGRKRRTEIVATLGTSSSHPDVIAEMYDAGTDIFRLDFSHGSLAAHGGRIRTIRALDTRSYQPAAILADLQGTRFRLGVMVGGFVSLNAGQDLRLELDPSPGNRRRIPLPHPEFFVIARPGDEVVISESQVRLMVMSAAHDHVETIVLAGGYIADAKSVAMPACPWHGTLTEKDRADATYAAALGVDWLGLQANCGVEAFAELKSLVGKRTRLMARFDTPVALAEIEDIFTVADGIMFARQDLAASLSQERLSTLQEKLFADCNATGKMMVAATQKLAGREGTANPSEAVSEEAAAVLRHGAHALMLSSGSALGAFPVENVVALERLIRTTECSIFPEGGQSARSTQEENQTVDVIQSVVHSRADKSRQARQHAGTERRKSSGDLCKPDSSHMTLPQ